MQLPAGLLKTFQEDNMADPVATLAGTSPRMGRPGDPFGSSLRDRMDQRRADMHNRMDQRRQDMRDRMNRGPRRGLR